MLVVAPRGAAAQPTGDGAAAAGEEQPGTELDKPRLLRASSTPAKAVNQTTNETGSHCVSIHGSPSHESVAISNHSMRGEPPHLEELSGVQDA